MYYEYMRYKILTLFLMFRALDAYFKVFMVSSKLVTDGETFAIIVVLELPIKESFKTYVSLLCLKGKWSLLPA
jgi:hypothetical protein